MLLLARYARSAATKREVVITKDEEATSVPTGFHAGCDWLLVRGKVIYGNLGNLVAQVPNQRFTLKAGFR